MDDKPKITESDCQQALLSDIRASGYLAIIINDIARKNYAPGNYFAQTFLPINVTLEPWPRYPQTIDKI